MEKKYGFDGRRLARVREERDMLQKELAAFIGVKAATVTAYETTGATPSPAKLALIAEALDISLDYLFGLSNDMVSYHKTNYLVLAPGSPPELKKAFEEINEVVSQLSHTKKK